MVVYKIDRLGRSLKHLVDTLEKWRMYDVGLISITQPFDTTRPEGKLFFHIVSAMAEFERELIRERTRAGLKRAVRQGKHLGRPTGSKDKKRRTRSGYYLRYAKKRGVANL